MKRIVITALALVLVLSLTACGEKSAERIPENMTVTESGELLLTIPKDMMKGVKQAELDEAVAAGTVNEATLNDDGTVTYQMTEEQHTALLDEIAESIDLTMEDMVTSGEYPSVTDIQCNEDYTHFTITTRSTELSLDESLAVLVFYMNGGVYATFNGTPNAEITVDYVNEESGEIISTASSAQQETAE